MRRHVNGQIAMGRRDRHRGGDRRAAANWLEVDLEIGMRRRLGQARLFLGAQADLGGALADGGRVGRKRHRRRGWRRTSNLPRAWMRFDVVRAGAGRTIESGFPLRVVKRSRAAISISVSLEGRLNPSSQGRVASNRHGLWSVPMGSGGEFSAAPCIAGRSGVGPPSGNRYHWALKSSAAAQVLDFDPLERHGRRGNFGACRG